METKNAYNRWAVTYDSVMNKTRDLEQIAAKQILSSADFSKVLEIGCGTGKNTMWLSGKSNLLTAVDFSEEMMNMARQKINSINVIFLQADITKPWTFQKVTLITCSLVLEHIENIDFIFEQAARILEDQGCFYICELHPYKQLQGTRARFEQGNQLIELEYFVHHISEFFVSAKNHGMQCLDLQEWFDENDRTTTPRLVSFLFQKF